MARRADRFAEVERADPTMAFVHLVAACAWMATLSIARAPEGITFGILMAVAAVRVPRTVGLYPGLVSSAAFVLFLAFVEWQALSVLWSSAPNLGVRDWLPRFAFVPLALWPVMHRWRDLLVPFVASAAVHGGLVGSAALWRSGWSPSSSNGLLTSDICMTGIVMATAMATLGAHSISSSPNKSAVRAIMGVPLLAGIILLGQRMPVIASVFGFATSAARTQARGRLGFGRIAVGSIVALAITVALLASGARNRAWLGTALQAACAPQGTVTDAQFATVTTSRPQLARIAAAMWSEHPWTGAGARSYEHEARRRLAEDPAAYGVASNQRKWLTDAACAHNAFLDEASERGVIGLGLLVALLAACWWRAWKLDPWSGTAGMLGVWTVACLTQSMTVRGVAVLLLAVIVTRCAFVERDP
jgi:O-antigen ligase